VCGQVVCQLALPVGEHGPQQPIRDPGVNTVGHLGTVAVDVGEQVLVPPGKDRGQRPGGQPVDEPAWRKVAVGLMHGNRPNPARQR
jgi:hypothetical protein